MDNNQTEGKHGRVMKRSKKRQSTDNDKKSAKFDDRDKLNRGPACSENESYQDLAESTSAETGSDGVCGDANSSEMLSLDSALCMILNHKKKEVLECPEVMQLLQQASRNP